MSDIELINRIREDARDLEARGRKTIRILALYNYLAGLEDELSDNSNVGDQAKFIDDGTLEHYKAQNQFELEFMRVVNTAGQTALKTGILINGGAAIAILAFTGNLVTKSNPGMIGALALALAAFVYGTLSCAFATGLTYISGYLSHNRPQWVFHVFNSFTILFVFTGYVLFAFGGYIAYNGLKQLAAAI